MEDEDWTDFATSDFGSTAVDLWSDVVPLRSPPQMRRAT